MLFCKNKIKLYRDRAVYPVKNHIFESSAEDLIDRILFLGNKINSALEIGARFGVLTEKIIESVTRDVVATDISTKMLTKNPSLKKFTCPDEDVFKIYEISNRKYDFISSLLNLHLIDNVEKFLRNIRALLSDKGIFLGCFFGENTLREFRIFLIEKEIELKIPNQNYIIPFMRIEDFTKIMQKVGFKNIVTDISKINVLYMNPMSLIRSLRDMGESNSIFESKIMNKRLAEYIINSDEKVETNFCIVNVYASNEALSIPNALT